MQSPVFVAFVYFVVPEPFSPLTHERRMCKRGPSQQRNTRKARKQGFAHFCSSADIRPTVLENQHSAFSAPSAVKSLEANRGASDSHIPLGCGFAAPGIFVSIRGGSSSFNHEFTRMNRNSVSGCFVLRSFVFRDGK